MTALDIKCPTCGARPDWFCETREGYFRERPHATRIERQATTPPEPEPLVRPEDRLREGDLSEESA